MQAQAPRVTSSGRSSLAALRPTARRTCSQHCRRASPTRCDARPEGESTPASMQQRMALVSVAALAGAMLVGTALPDDAMAARSGGRMGGSSFRSARPAPSRAAPSRSAPSRGGSTYNTYVAPPVYGGYGYGGGISMFPTFISPIFGFGGFFNIFVTMIVASTVFNVIRSIASSGDRKDDE